MTEKRGYIVAIDGPVASGKGTVAKALATKLHGYYLTTGLFYRAVAFYCLENALVVEDEKAVMNILSDVHITMTDDRIFLNEKDVTEQLYERGVDQVVAKVSNYIQVRQYLIPQQRTLAIKQSEKGKVVIIEGRDTATKVSPDALVKIYLTSDVLTRAKRRLVQMKLRQKEAVTLADVVKDTKERDYQDLHGAMKILVTDPENYGYSVIDNTNLTLVQTLEKIVNLIEEKTGKHI